MPEDKKTVENEKEEFSEDGFFFENLRKDYYENLPDQRAIEDFFFENETGREEL